MIKEFIQRFADEKRPVTTRDLHKFTGYRVDEIIVLMGLMNNEINLGKQITFIEGHYPLVKITVKSDLVFMDTTLNLKNKTIWNSAIKVYKTKRGTGTSIIKHQVNAATENGFKKIRLDASARREGFTRLNGFITWAKLGFVMFVDNDLAEFEKRIKLKNRDDKNLDVLLNSMEGSRIWEQIGFTWRGEFDLEDGSESRQIFDRYLQRKQSDKKWQTSV